MQAAEADAGAGRMAGGAEGLDSQGGSGGRGGRGGPRSGGAAAAANDGALCAAPAQHSPAPGGHPASTARSALSVPFPSTLEAEIARGSLAPDAELHHGAVGKELTVSGSVLAVHWRAEDSHLLQISIVNFLDQLSLVIRTMQRFGPPVAR
ncbi:EKC/KEOPS complex subunit LAGE3 [Phocoena phocoena]|uniref:EKC/KEOPS complex subunit LAGE3 n=1 Tax=Phocoena phocoena TaxID=9742 RepID=UPI003306C133